MVRMYRNSFALFLVCCLGMLVEPAHCRPGPGIKYIENKNQWPEEVDYSARVPGGRMFVEPGRFIYNFLDEGKLEDLHLQTHSRTDGEERSSSDKMINGHTVVVDFIGANTSSAPLSFGKSLEYYNYFLGKDSCKWASRAHAYEGFIYRSFYNGIDLNVYSEGTNVKYDFIVSPGADPKLIAFTYNGHETIGIDGDGDLVVSTSVSSMREKKPVAYQFIDGKHVVVPCMYSLNSGQVVFLFPSGYDPCHELVIDPLLIFSTYSGSTADNWGSTATPGENGALYSAGVTNKHYQGNFPATPGAFQVTYGGQYDVGILKYDSSGHQLLYATYLGGSDQDSPESLVMNANEELLILGVTGSSDFPTSVDGFDKTYNGGSAVSEFDGVIPFDEGSDIFISRISRDGDRLFSSTFLGGSQNDGMIPPYGDLDKNYGDMLRGDIITDVNNNVYISSVTSSNNFPAVNGLDLTYNGGPADAVVAKFDPNLSTLVWATYLGGNGTDASLSIKFDASGNNIYLAGGTTSGNFPVTTGSYQTTLAGGADGWIAKMNNSGKTIHNLTFTGTTSFDQVYFLDLNEFNEVYVYGQTSGNFPITPGVYSNPNSGQFIQKFNNSLNTLIFSTVIGSGGGIPDISPTAFLVNECNNLYLSGWGGAVNITRDYWQSNTVGMPITDDAFQKTTSGSDFYFMVLTDDASQFLYGTYLGATKSQTHVDGGTSRFDKSGIVYHAVCSGCRLSASDPINSDFPTTPGAWSATNNSYNCNNLAFKFDLSSLKARLQSNSVKFDTPGLSKVCMPDKIVFQNLSTGGESFEWDLGDGTKLTKVDTAFIVHQYLATGRYTVTLKAIDKGTCKVEDVASIKVDVFVAKTEVQDDDDMCLDSPYTLKASGGAVYDWRSEDGSFISNAANPVVNPKDTTRYFITITERSGCIQKDTVQLNVIPVIIPEFEIDRSEECVARPRVSVTNLTDSLWNGDRLFYDFGDGSTSEQLETEHTYEKDGLYNVKLVGVREFCVSETIVPMPVFTLLIPNIITPGNEDETNDRFTIQYGNTPGTTPKDFDFKTAVTIFNRWGEIVYESLDYQYDWKGDGVGAGIYFYEVTVDQHSTCKGWLHLVK